MHEIRTIAIDDPGICQTVMWLHLALTAERVNVLFGVETLGDLRNINIGHNFPQRFYAAFTNYSGLVFLITELEAKVI